MLSAQGALLRLRGESGMAQQAIALRFALGGILHYTCPHTHSHSIKTRACPIALLQVVHGTLAHLLGVNIC